MCSLILILFSLSSVSLQVDITPAQGEISVGESRFFLCEGKFSYWPDTFWPHYSAFLQVNQLWLLTVGICFVDNFSFSYAIYSGFL